MGHIFCMMGKSSSGKDSLFSKLICDEKLDLKRIVPYTTRPIRDGETDGKEYNFSTVEELTELEKRGLVVEKRVYNTYYGDWHYFTVDDGNIDLNKNDYLVIGTLESFEKFLVYFGKEKVVPLYIEVEDGVRLLRAIEREKGQEKPRYEELCRRFLADADDFSEEKLEKIGISVRYQNDDFEKCLDSLRDFIWTLK